MAFGPVSLRPDPSNSGRVGPSTVVLVGLGALILLFGLGGGWALGQRGSDASAPPTTDPKPLDIQADVASLVNSPNSDAGAARAANVFLQLYAGGLNGTTPISEVGSVIAPTADLAFKKSVTDGITQAKAQLASAQATDNGAVSLTPLSYAVRTEGKATVVTIWSVLVSAGGDQGVADAKWFTSDIALVRDSGGWKVNSWLYAPGPSPQSADTPAPPEDLLNRIRSFNDFVLSISPRAATSARTTTTTTTAVTATTAAPAPEPTPAAP